jgi:uncharacterized protein (TIGR00251 family)
MPTGLVRDFLLPHPKGALVLVRVKPNSRKNSVTPTEDWLEIKCHSPAVDGAANKAILEVLSDIFLIPKSNIYLLMGERTKYKKFLLENMSQELACTRLQTYLGLLPIG